MVQEMRGAMVSEFSFYRFESHALARVPTAPRKPGKTGPDLENLEKQGVLGQKPGKILKNLEKKFDLTLKRPKSLNRKSIWKKKSSSSKRSIVLHNFET